MIVSDEAFEYLKWQAGDLYDLHTDRAKWESSYEAKLRAQYENIKPWLPSVDGKPVDVLDVGSGLSGISILLNEHYSGAVVPVLIDGADDKPKMSRHAETHSHSGIARRFLEANGLTLVGFGLLPIKFDLVISLSAWCFHFGPAVYLDFVTKCCTPDTVIILDVRRGKTDWNIDLAGPFREIAVIHEAPKFQRKVFRLA